MLLRNLATSLVIYEKINTTKAKAKAVQPIMDKIINLGKKNNLTSRRTLLQILTTSKAVKKIFEVLAPRYQSRNSGYTRILNLSPRHGDGAILARIEFIK